MPDKADAPDAYAKYVRWRALQVLILLATGYLGSKYACAMCVAIACLFVTARGTLGRTYPYFCYCGGLRRYLLAAGTAIHSYMRRIRPSK